MQEDNVLSVRTCIDTVNGRSDLFDMMNRVRYTGILGYALIIEIAGAVCSNGNVLQKSVSSDCVIDIRLRFLIQTDNLSIAATFEVEDTIVIPAVLVITDEESLRVGRQGGLTGT